MDGDGKLALLFRKSERTGSNEVMTDYTFRPKKADG